MTQAPTPGPLDSESVKLLVKGDLLWYEPESGRAELVWLRRNHKGVLAVQSVRDPDCGHGDDYARFAFIGRPAADGWMPWSGGENPVPGQMVEVRYRDGGISAEPFASDGEFWQHSFDNREARATDIIAFRLAPTAPVEASGSEREAAGCAEPQVGCAVYERIEKLLKTNPQGWERNYLCHLVESVEELGGYDGPRLDRRDDRQAVADFLKLRDENVGPGEADDAERLESADAILALLSARPLALGGQPGAERLPTVDDGRGGRRPINPQDDR